MEDKICILLIDDSEDEAWLLQEDLSQGGLESIVERVDSEGAVRESMQKDSWDILLLDYRMPGLAAERVLEIYREMKCRVPLIIYSGAIGEVTAVNLIRAGARDYVSKNNRSRLLSVIKRELRERQLRTERAEAKRELRESEKILAAIAEMAQDAILMMDGEGRVAYWNQAARRMMGYGRKEAMGMEVESHLIPNRFRNVFKRFLRRFHTSGSGGFIGKTTEFAVLHQSGREIPVELSSSSVSIRGEWWMVSILRDITERKKTEKQLRHLAGHDALTGLYNRRVLEQRLEEEIQRSIRYDKPLTLFFLDIDHFKQVNDRYGHHAGDDLLRQLGQKLKANMRSVDLAARYGGEEFVLMMPELSGATSETMAERLCAEIAAHSFVLQDDLKLHITISIGLAWYPQHGATAGTLLDAADHAMYQAKLDGRNRIRIAPDLNNEVQDE